MSDSPSPATTPSHTLQEALDLLDTMSFEEIVAWLEAHPATRGTRGSCAHCPVAKMLLLLTGRTLFVDQDDAGAFAWPPGLPVQQTITLPRLVARVVSGFDAGELPQLVAA